MGTKRTVPDLKVGDVVRWTSTSKGTARRKMGTVAAVVPAGQHPDLVAFGKLWQTGAGPGLPRKTVSYVVLVKRPRSKQPYWPRPELLNKYDQLSSGPMPKEADLMTRHQPASVSESEYERTRCKEVNGRTGERCIRAVSHSGNHVSNLGEDNTRRDLD